MRVLAALLILTGCSPVLPAKRVIAIGDSETYGRGLERWYAYPQQLGAMLGDEWTPVNAGVSGETTRDMLRRFQPDVLDRHPDAVIILGGENDIYYGYGAGDASYTLDSPTGPEANIAEMVRLAESAGIKAYVGTMLPHGTIEEAPPRQEAMVELLAWQREQRQLIDFNEAVSDPSRPGYSLPSLTLDNVHPSEEGAAIMARTAADALRR